VYLEEQEGCTQDCEHRHGGHRAGSSALRLAVVDRVLVILGDQLSAMLVGFHDSLASTVMVLELAGVVDVVSGVFPVVGHQAPVLPSVALVAFAVHVPSVDRDGVLYLCCLVLVVELADDPVVLVHLYEALLASHRARAVPHIRGIVIVRVRVRVIVDVRISIIKAGVWIRAVRCAIRRDIGFSTICFGGNYSLIT